MSAELYVSSFERQEQQALALVAVPSPLVGEGMQSVATGDEGRGGANYSEDKARKMTSRTASVSCKTL